MSVFVGTWEWKYTILDDNVCSPIPAPVITHTPEQDGFTYRLEIEKKGKLRIFVNGKKDKCYRLVKRDFADHSSDTTFSFSLNNKKGSGVYFTYKKRNNIKYLESAYFPQNILRGFDGCRTEYSVFEKVE